MQNSEFYAFILTAKTSKMKEANVLQLEPKIHNRNEALVFRAKAFLLQLKRSAENLVNPGIKSFKKNADLADFQIIAESKTALWTEKDRAEMPLMWRARLTICGSPSRN